MYVDMFSGIVIAGAIVYVGQILRKELYAIRVTLNVHIDALASAVQDQTAALTRDLDSDQDDNEDDGGTPPVNS